MKGDDRLPRSIPHRMAAKFAESSRLRTIYRIHYPHMEPLTYAIDRTRRFTTVDYHRQPSFEQWMAAMGQIFTDPKRKAGFGFLLNREWVFFPADRGYIEKMVRFIDDHQSSEHPIRWAIFVSDEGSFAMGQMAERITNNGGSIRVFRRRPEAEDWLLQSREGTGSQAPTS